jgi:aminopeptidase YwaD
MPPSGFRRLSPAVLTPAICCLLIVLAGSAGPASSALAGSVGPASNALAAQPFEGTAQAGEAMATIDHLFEQVRSAYSGEKARETVAFMESHWRLPGNSGFDASIYRVAEILQEAGYVLEDEATDADPLTYRIESRPMDRPAWEPVDASLTVVGASEPLLDFASNRNMLATYSFPTPAGGVEADLVYVGTGRTEDFEGKDVTGKIVFGEARVGQLFRAAVQERGALGVLSYRLPDYTQPEVYQDSIVFSRVSLDEELQAWGICLSYAAKTALLDALDKGSVRVRVETDAKIYDAPELTIVADVRGSALPRERIVYSAHVQEPGANDNASGVGAQAEMARVLAQLLQAGLRPPQRTITFLWGDEISSTRTYLADDPARAEDVLWGMSLDMVGEDTTLTGGSFLVERMPDPSAVWPRGVDVHTEWGAGRRGMSLDQMTPHYINDLVLALCRQQGEATNWQVGTNPYEGGSDHVPFLRADVPAVLLWHFTDAFYHTDGDRLDKVSAATLKNVGVSALVFGLVLTAADGAMARHIVDLIETAAVTRLEGELQLSLDAVEGGAEVADQMAILDAWIDWYEKAVLTASDIEVGGSSPQTFAAIESAVGRVGIKGHDLKAKLSAR